MSRYYEDKCCKYDYCKKDYCKCDYCKKCCCCDKIKVLVWDANFHAGKARIGIETIFQYEDPCQNIDVILALQKEADENLEKLICILKELNKCYEKDCFDCDYESAYILQRAIRNAEVANYHWDALRELLCECKCECVECEAYILVRVAFERILVAEVEVAALKRLLKYKEDPCKKEC